MRVETLLEQLFFTTVMIEAQLPDDQSSTGTGFVYQVPLRRDQNAAFLVTNKHVIAGAERVDMRLHAAEGPGNAEVKLGTVHDVSWPNPENYFFGHPDSDIDVTVCPLGPAINALAAQDDFVFYRSLAPDIAADDSKFEELDAIEEITFLGYPNGLYDHANYLPLGRRGHTATPPMVDYEGKPIFLVDASVFPGSSGSPVLIANSGTFAARGGAAMAGTRVLLLGVLAAVYQRQVPVLELPTRMRSVVSDTLVHRNRLQATHHRRDH
jgi:hypothetical protein